MAELKDSGARRGLWHRCGKRDANEGKGQM